ncbi:MAG: cytochrome P460 family protein [Phycisphaerales bacterium JB039]
MSIGMNIATSLAATLAAGAVGLAIAAAAPNGPGGPPAEGDARQLWDWLDEAGYRQWAPWPGAGKAATVGFYQGRAPHGARLKLFVNRRALSNPDDPPAGSVLVKENYGPDGGELVAITIMQKIDGFDPDNGDWFYAKYGAEGAIARQAGQLVAGKVQSCIECHETAAGDDYIFANDEDHGRGGG